MTREQKKRSIKIQVMDDCEILGHEKLCEHLVRFFDKDLIIECLKELRSE